jgi:CDP-glycerol glycerophosphotransferase (TagB/SpsB family)
MGIVFITAEIEGTHINSHKLPIQPIFDILVQQGYNCKWGKWWGNWGSGSGIPSDEIDFYVTGDVGIPGDERNLRSKTFFHTHGLHPVEKGYVSPRLWYAYLAPGKLWYNVANRHGELIHQNFDPERIPVTGWAKMDVLFKKTREEIISEYNLRLPHEKTVLYAPAGNWDYATSFDKSIEHILNIFSRLPYNLIIKNAVYSSSFKKWGYFMEAMKNPPANITTIMAPHKQTTAVEAAMPDITPLYKIADAMITDGSSVAWEFIGVDKPSIQLTNMIDPASSIAPMVCNRYCDIENERGGLRYKSEYGKSVIVNDYDECRSCGGIIKTSLEDLEYTIIEAIETPNLYAKERRIWSKLINEYVDGKCAQRCVDAIKRIAGI